MCFYYVPIGSKSSYPVQKFLLGAFLLGPKVPIGHVPIGLTDEFIGLKNSSQSARFWFLLGAFLLGTPPVFIFNFFLHLLIVDIFRLSMRLEVECRILFPLTFLGFCICYWIYYWPVISNIIWSNFCHFFFANFGFIRILLSLV